MNYAKFINTFNLLFLLLVVVLIAAYTILIYAYSKKKQTSQAIFTGTTYAYKAFVSVIIYALFEIMVANNIQSDEVLELFRLMMASFFAIFIGSSLYMINKEAEINIKRTNIETIGLLILASLATIIIIKYPQYIKTYKIIQIFITLYLIVKYIILGFAYLLLSKEITLNEHYKISKAWMVTLNLTGLVAISNILFLQIIGKAHLPEVNFYNNLFFSIYGVSYLLQAIRFLNTEQEATPSTQIAIPGTETPEKQPLYANQTSAITKGIEAFLQNKEYLNPNIGLDELAANIKSNRSYVSSYINDKYGMTFSSWINIKRIEEAKELLLSNNKYNLEEISERCGFSSKNYFITIFSKLENETPTSWKKSRENIIKKEAIISET